MADPSNDTARLAALDEPVRKALFEYVRRHEGPTSRNEAGDAVGISRSLAAYHLDRLVEAGLLRASYGRPDGRTGPGAGRPAKLYEPAEGELAITVPPRDYEFAASLLADAADREKPLVEVARDSGRGLGRAAAPAPGKQGLERALAERGYEPFDEDGVTRMRNCPFHRLAVDHRDLVCGMNLSFLEGFLEGLDRPDLEGSLEPMPGRCCVAIRERR
jgi:predicted ArsR family transcriptional regulator